MRRYLAGLVLPQVLEQEARCLANRCAGWGGIRVPLPALLPVCESTTRIREPVSGLLPICPAPLQAGNSLCFDSRWSLWYWPVESGQWLGALAKSLVGDEHGDGEPVYPMVRGIPVGLVESGGRGDGKLIGNGGDGVEPGSVDKLAVDGHFPWKSLDLICLEWVWSEDLDWYRAAAWKIVWKRRLRRAGAVQGADPGAVPGAVPGRD